MDNQDLERRRMLDDELRPTLSAEALSPRMRAGLFMLVLLTGALWCGVLIATVVWPDGLLTVSPFVAASVVGLGLATSWFLLVIFGGLVLNNRQLDPVSRGLWVTSFLLFSAVSLPAYWFVYVRDARYTPWTPPHDAHPSPTSPLSPKASPV